MLPRQTYIDRGTCHNGAQDNDDAADEHAPSSAPSIDGRTDEWKSCNGSNLVEKGNDSRPDALVLTMEEVEECLVGCKTAKQGTIKTVHGLTEEPNKRAQDEQQGRAIEEGWFLLQKSLIEGFCAFHCSDFNNILTGISVMSLSIDLTHLPLLDTA